MEDLMSRLDSDELTRQQKLDCAAISIKLLVAEIVKNHGETFDYWLGILYGTKLYQSIMKVETGYWGEGTSYLYSKFTKEVGLNV